MYYDGSDNKGTCPAIGPSVHVVAGYNFSLEHL
ncbi:hypothetical protein FsymDg_3372 [Candidatus Protofrankia datiscae]|uniref:Uncharacterized protein n=1 Tax=Candidatus Protofrankia datiscae TaxID=2716812 RepID=F8B0N9_9ACTN|nr:hypothetical protein FsymDg_3372 [Candidatus Protofrankia datiscae]